MSPTDVASGTGRANLLPGRPDARRIGQIENRDTLEAKLNSLKEGDNIADRKSVV